MATVAIEPGTFNTRLVLEELLPQDVPHFSTACLVVRMGADGLVA
jgi:hypothetical protein